MYRIHRAVHWAPLDAYIRSLAPAAWFRQGVGITVTGSGVSQWDDQSGNGRHLLQGTDAARPIDLPFSGERYLYLPGVAGNYASTPDSAANSITGDIDIRVRVALDDWTPSAAQVLAAKWTTAGDLSWRLFVAASGAITLTTSADGSTSSSATSSASAGVTDKADKWVRATRGVASGVVKFYLSDDGFSWTQLGTDQSNTSGQIHDGNAAIEIGAHIGGSSAPLAGKIYRAIVKNGIDGTTVVDFNPADASDSAASFASSTTGETWTINSTGSLPAQIVGRSSVLFNGSSHYLKCNAFTLNQPTCVLMVVKQVSWTNADYIFDGNTAASNVLLQTAASPDIRISAGSVVAVNGGLAVGAIGVVACGFNGANSFIKVNKNTPTTGNAGANNAGGFTLGSRADGGVSWSNIQVYETVIFPIAPSTAQLDRLVAGLMARHGVA